MATKWAVALLFACEATLFRCSERGCGSRYTATASLPLALLFWNEQSCRNVRIKALIGEFSDSSMNCLPPLPLPEVGSYDYGVSAATERFPGQFSGNRRNIQKGHWHHRNQ